MRAGDWDQSIDRAWGTCNRWWGMDRPTEASVFLRFSKLTPAGVARAFMALKARSVEHRTGSLWALQEGFDPNCIGTEESLEKLAIGALHSMTIHYVWKSGERRLEALLTVTRMKRGQLRANLHVLWSSIGTSSCDMKSRFHVLLGHGHELLQLLEAKDLEVGRQPTGVGTTREKWLRLTG